MSIVELCIMTMVILVEEQTVSRTCVLVDGEYAQDVQRFQAQFTERHIIMPRGSWFKVLEN